MIVHLITAVALAALVLVCTWAVFRTLKKRMPGSLIPLLLGATVIAYGIYSEYSWESRTLAQMPESVEVVHRIAGKSMFSPWAYLIPRIDRLSVVDTAAALRNPEHPDFVMFDLLLLQRFNPVIRVHQIVNCSKNQRSDISASPQFNAQGLPVNAKWENLDSSHGLIKAVCISP